MRGERSGEEGSRGMIFTVHLSRREGAVTPVAGLGSAANVIGEHETRTVCDDEMMLALAERNLPLVSVSCTL